VALASRRWGVDGDETPRLSTSYTGTAILNLAGAPGRLARHLRRPSPGSGIHCAAEVSQMQTPTARVGQAAIVRRKTADVRHCPPQTAWLEKYDPSHMMRWGRQDTIRGAYRQWARRGEVTRVVIPRPHPGTRGTNKAPIEPASQAGTAEAAAGGASAVVKPSADGFQDDCHPGAGPDRAHPDCAVEGRNRTREAGRPGRQSGHRVAGDRRPAGCDQTSGATALPAPPSWQHDRSGSTQVTSGKSGQCQRSGGTDNMCCRAHTGQQRYLIRHLTSGNGRDHGVDNVRCPCDPTIDVRRVSAS
jgi:hypothetical protein